MPATTTDTKIADRKWQVPALAAIPPTLQTAIAATVDYHWDGEEDDYLHHCSNIPGGNQRTGHIFESLSLLRRFLEGNTDGGHVDTEVMVTNPAESPGGYHTLLRTRTKTVREVHAELVTLLGTEDDGFAYVPGAEEYFDIYPAVAADQEWPVGRIVVFAVTGSSEGHYVHVEVLRDDDASRRLLILGKGFSGADDAWALARRLADILHV
jgi:hypothetical protein